MPLHFEALEHETPQRYKFQDPELSRMAGYISAVLKNKHTGSHGKFYTSSASRKERVANLA
jgi:hypothetical protein